MHAVCTFDSVEAAFEKLRRFYVVSIVTREIPFQTEIKARDFTRHDSIGVRFYIVGENADIDIADSVPFDCTTFRSATNITGLKILVDTLANTNLVTGKQFPTRLKQRE